MRANDPAAFTPAAVVIEDVAFTERLRQMEHFAELGRLSASLLHEISNPLTAALLYLEQYDNRHPQHIRHIKYNMLLLQRYVEAARQQVRHESPITSFYVRQQIDQVRRVLAPLARRKAVKLSIEQHTNYKLIGDPVKFQQILANLIINAIDSYDEAVRNCTDKSVVVALSCQRQWLLVKVTDHGAGIPHEQIPQVFEPFYTTKSQRGQGLGIGLAVVRQHIERDFGGSVSVTSSVKAGTQFNAKLRLTPGYY